VVSAASKAKKVVADPTATLKKLADMLNAGKK
jgi:hypothetical protein